MKDKTKLIIVQVIMGILALAAFLTLVSGIGGCSNMKQSAEITKDGIKLSNSKSSFMYWSKYKASVHNYGMSAIVYNAEGHPDPNSVKAVAEGVVDAFLKGAGL